MPMLKTSRLTRFAALLLGSLLAFTSLAQETEDATAVETPNLVELQTNWWSFFEGSKEEVEPKVDPFFDDIESQISGLEAQNEEVAAAILVAVRDNVAAYLALLDDLELEPLQLQPAAFEYAIDDLLRLSADARQARANARDEQMEVDREERTLAGVSRRRDTAFDDYVGATAGDERWLAALRLMQARSAQAISERRLELLTQRFDRANAFSEVTVERVEVAKDRLTATADEADLPGLSVRVNLRKEDVESVAEALRAAQLAASGLDPDTADGRSQQRLLQQRLLGAEVNLALAETVLAQAEAKELWTQLVSNVGPDTSAVTNQMLVWSEELRGSEDRTAEWQRGTEDELLAVQSANRDDLSRASRRILDQRQGTAQETLADISVLGTAVADLELLMEVVDIAAAERTGAIGSLFAKLQRGVKTAYIRVVGLADVTLFSIGEAPVTGGDILRVILILIFAMLLSRGIRMTIRRFGDAESSGTQASLYTVGRLTHYVIIIFALFIALSSIGLDFGNLALVAGALSVGIGFGLQSIVNNFVSGLIILFEHSLRVGDYIELDTGLTGTVKSINVRSTLINTNDNIDIVVPNSEFVTARLTNWTLGERILRVRIPFGVAYGSDKDLVKQAALEAAADVPYTLTNMKGREPDAWLTEFGDNSLNFLLLVWVNRQGARRPTRTRSAYLWALESKLTEYGIEIPFPQRDLHLRSGFPQNAAVEPPTQEESQPSDE
ncbi:MAG: mechanosensitive ion channel family protein [Woeseiaceae bacterium]